jgi:dipeptidyl aminopeptidase/acylaminoacyl peptidase
MKLSIVLIGCLISLGAAATPERASAPRLAPLPLQDALKVRQFSMFTAPNVSPDGRFVAYSIQDLGRADRPIWGSGGRLLTETGADLLAYGGDVYVTELSSGNTLNISGSVGSSYYASWSADSRQLAFYSDRDGKMRVWIWDVATKALRRVSDAVALPNAPLAPMWGDEGRQLLVSMLPEGLTYLDVERRSIGQVNPVTPHMAGSTVSVYSHERDERGEVSAETQLMQGYDGYSTPPLRDLAQIDVATGEYKRLLRSFAGNLLGVSADGRYALATSQSRADERNYNDALFNIFVLEVASGREVMKIPDVPMVWGTSAGWAPSGHRFAYITGSRSEWRTPYFQGAEETPRRTGDVFVAEVGKEPFILSKGEHPSFSTGNVPVWTADGQAIFVMGGDTVWRADVSKRTTRAVTKPDAGRRYLKIAAVRGGAQLWQPKGAGKLFVFASDSATLHEEIDMVDIATGAVTPVLQKEQSYAGGFTGNFLFDAAHSTAPAVFAAMSATQPNDLYATEDFSRVRRLTQLNPIFDQFVMGRSRLVTWRGHDGKHYKGTLLLPAGYQAGKRYPMVVWQRPSNIGSMALNVFGLLSIANYQLLATRGYAVFYPDFPAATMRDVQQVARDVLFPGIDAVVELGIADKDRIGVTGISLGGYSTVVLATMTDRFKVAVAEAGPTNNFSAFTTFLRSGNAFRVQEMTSNLGGTPWSARETYIETSPFFFLDRVQTPLMMVHARGDGDYTVPQLHADQVFVGLRSLNRTVTMVLHDGGHGISSYSYPDQVDCWTRVIDWFDRFIGNSN